MRELIDRINAFDKENLFDILHYISEGIIEITDSTLIRIYLEELREGALKCLYTPEGELERMGGRIPIQNRESRIVKAFLEASASEDISVVDGMDDLHQKWAADRGLQITTVFPLGQPGQSIGVICLDSRDQTGPIISQARKTLLEDLFSRTNSVLREAHRFYRQIILNRHLDVSRKKDAARILLSGVLDLDGSIDLASVLIPAETPVSSALWEQRGGFMEILAAVSREPSRLAVYENLERISLLEGKSLLSGLVAHAENGVVRRPGAPDVLYYEDILSEKFDRFEIFSQLSLRTLLMIPVVGDDGSVICVVNYFSRERAHVFSGSDLVLLGSHAGAVGDCVSGPAEEHFEIRVLSEIEELLIAQIELPVFLNRVVSIVNGFVGADSGSIALVAERDGQKWLLVEDAEDEGRLVGAKSMEWRKSYIPPLKVGGEDLPDGERSLTGHVAFTGKPFLCSNTALESRKGGFYRELVGKVMSELAVPILVGENVIGVINLDSYQEGFFTLEHQRIMLLISRLIASRIADMIKIGELKGKVEKLKREVTYKSPEVTSYVLGNIIGKSEASRKLVDRIGKIAAPLANCLVKWDSGEDKDLDLGLPTLLIAGETGSGKEFVFNNLYSLLDSRYSELGGKKGHLPVRKTNIAAYGGDLTYTELFGHVKGAYTGAYSDRIGILEEADGGVVFLDEIGDADQKTQVQLLRYLDSGEFTRLGDNRVRRSRVVLVAATNRDLSAQIEAGSFREDLFHRLNELSVRVPPLSGRREDIPDLARHFLSRLHFNYSMGTSVPRLDDEAAALLREMDYPGNIRQLVSVLQGALIESSGGGVGKEEILRAVTSAGNDFSSYSAQEEAAIFARIRQGEGDFWSLVHTPFTNHEITRSQVVKIYQMALAGGGNVKGTARVLRALPVEGIDEGKALTKFRNFIYKTVGVGRARN